MKRIIRFLLNREMWETVDSVASLVQVIAVGIAEFERLQNIALLLSGVSAALQLSVGIGCRRAERGSVQRTRPAETTNSENFAN